MRFHFLSVSSSDVFGRHLVLRQILEFDETTKQEIISSDSAYARHLHLFPVYIADCCSSDEIEHLKILFVENWSNKTLRRHINDDNKVLIATWFCCFPVKRSSAKRKGYAKAISFTKHKNKWFILRRQKMSPNKKKKKRKICPWLGKWVAIFFISKNEWFIASLIRYEFVHCYQSNALSTLLFRVLCVAGVCFIGKRK